VVAASADNLGAAGSDLAFVGGTLRLAGDIDSGQNIFIASQGGTVDTADWHFKVGAGLAGSGHWRKVGPGTLSLHGNHAGFTGTIEVATGHAALSGSIGGNLALNTGTVLDVGATATTVTRFDVGGTVTLAGGTLAVAAAAGNYPARSRVTLLSAGAGVSGVFDTATIDRDGLKVAVGYTDDTVVLSIVRADTSLTTFAVSPEQLSSANALDSLLTRGNGQGSAELQVVLDALNLLSAEELPLALESIAGTSLAGIQRSLGQTARVFTRTVSQRLNFVGGSGVVGSGGGLFGAAALAAAPGMSASRHGAWVRGFGGSGSVEVSTLADDQSLQFGGVAAGYDFALRPQLTVGGLFVFSEATVAQDAPGYSNNIDSWQLGVYGRWQAARAYVDVTAGYSHHDFDSDRTIVLGPSTLQAKSSFVGHSWNSRIESGYGMGPGRVLEPFVAFNHTTQKTDGYAERGAGALALVTAANTETSLTSELGLRLNFDLPLPSRLTAGVALYGAWAHEFTGAGTLSARLAGDAAAFDLAIIGIDPADDALRFGTAVHFLGRRNLRIFISVDGEVDARQEVFSTSAGLRYSW
jgi:uncharacterized protein with beta-barrel porin domain